MSLRSSTFNFGTSSTPNVIVPANVAADDIVILVATIDHPTAVFDAGDWPSGFTELLEVDLTLDGHSAAVGWKRLTGADSGTYQFGDLGQSGDWVCHAYAFSGRHTTNPPVAATAATNNNANTSPVTITANGVTAVDGDDLLWISAPDVSAQFSGAGHAAPTNYTVRRDTEYGWSNLCGATRENVSAGATGSVSGTFSVLESTSGWAAFLIRIPAAPGGGGGGGFTSWEEWAAHPDARRLWLVEIQAFSLQASDENAATLGEASLLEFALLEGTATIADAVVKTLRFATEDFVTDAADTPARTPYLGIVNAVRVDHRTSSLPYGGAANVFAEVELANGDGALDGLLEAYALDGRECIIRVGDPSWLVTTGEALSFIPVFQGTVVSAEISTRTLRLRLDSKMRLLNVPLQRNFYDATVVQNQALAGAPIPLLYGTVYNIAPPMINSQTLTYQIHDGPISAVLGVYDRGIALVAVEDATQAGEYTANLANGTFRLGAQPDGQITVDAKRVTGFSDPWWGIFKPIVEYISSELTVNGADLVGFVGAFRGDSGAWYGTDPVNAIGALNDLTRGAGMFWWATSTDVRIVHPWITEGTPQYTFDETEVYDIERIPPPTDASPAVWRVEVTYRKNYTVQSDLAGAVPASRVGELALPSRTSAVESSGTASRHLHAQTLRYESAYNEADGAERIASANMSVWGEGRAQFIIRASFLGVLVQLGDVVALDLPRFSLNGVNLLVTRVSLDTGLGGATDLEGLLISPDFYNWTSLPLLPQ